MNRQNKYRYYFKDTQGTFSLKAFTLEEIERGKVVDYRYMLFKPVEVVARAEWTGFTDAGREELYDGDVIEDDAEWFLIKWDEDGGYWNCRPIVHSPLERDNIALAELAGSSACWKQGNIWQNPEFLTQNK